MLLRAQENCMKKYCVIGLMSGTSLDGVDIACCYFSNNDEGWTFEIGDATTVEYTGEWHQKISTLHKKSAEVFAKTHVEFGQLLGSLTKEFIQRLRLQVDFVSSHGHTIFHQPNNQFTFQIGEGAALSAASGLPVVCDFRSKDVALGGQGAPLVPIGDELLFSKYNYCLNLGGIANISFNQITERIAFDVTPCNMVLNQLSSALGMKYDDGGQVSKKGKVNELLLKQLNECGFYSSGPAGPKSLGREDVERDFFSIIHSHDMTLEDKLRTFSEHIAVQISSVVNHSGKERNERKKLLITGGGAFNTFLVQRIASLSQADVIIPDKKIIEYKEALIFAFLGVLRWRGEVNCLKSVTGSVTDHVGGAIYM